MNNSPSSQLALDTCVYASVSIVSNYEGSWRQTEQSGFFFVTSTLILSQNTFCYQHHVV